MMKKIALALLLALMGIPAWALSPSYSGGGGGEGAGNFLSPTVTGTGAAFNVAAGELVRVPVFVEIGTVGTAPAIIAITNDVTPLAWHRRASVIGTVGEASGGGGVTVCTGNFELWEAYSPSAITATHVSVTISAASDSAAWYVNRYANTWGAARPSDGNASLPVAISNNAGAGAAPTATIPATTQADDLIVGYAAYCASELANSGAAGYTANNSYQDGGGNYNQQGAISKSVSALQSGLAVTFGGGISAPAGYFMIADALTNDAPPPKSVATSAPVASDVVITASGGGCGSIPAPVTAAGWSTCVINNDFSLAFYATQSNWLDCAGASTPQWYKAWIGFDASAIPCAFASQQTDPASGLPALRLHAQDSYFATSAPLKQAPIQTVPGTTGGLRIPPNAYFEVTARSAFAGTPAPGSGWKWHDYWSYTTDGSSIEWDGIEINLNDAGGLISAATYHNNASGVTNQLWSGNPVDYSTYHKYAWRVTSNGTSDAFWCSYIDDVSHGCQSWGPTSGELAGIDQTMQLFVGCYNYPCGSHDAYISRVRIFSCAAANSGAKCFTSSPNP